MADLRRGLTTAKRIRAISRQVAIYAQSWVTQNLFGLQGPPPDTTTVLRVPVRTPIFSRPAFAQTVFATNLLLTTLAGGSISVTPAAATLTTATFAATVTASTHQTVTPTTASLTATASVPTVTASAHQTVTPSTASLTTAPLAPTVTTTAHQTVTPSSATLTTSTFAPAVTTSGNQSVTPTTATLASTVYTPTVTVSSNQSVTPGTASLTTATYAPSVTATGGAMPFASGDWQNPTRRIRQVVPYSHRHDASPSGSPQSVTPTTAALATTTYAPTVTAGPVVYPFSQGDWPNPRINPKYRQFLNSGRVLGEEPFPFTQTEWPNPNRRVLAEPAVTQSVAYTLVPVPVSVTPTTAALILTTYAPAVSGVSTQGALWQRRRRR